MNRQLVILVVCVSGLIVAGCGGASLDQVHEPQLLDEKALQQNVVAELRHAGNEFKNVKAQAHGNTVVLTGRVASREAHDRAIAVSQGVYGVESVQDELEVTKRPP